MPRKVKNVNLTVDIPIINEAVETTVEESINEIKMEAVAEPIDEPVVEPMIETNIAPVVVEQLQPQKPKTEQETGSC